MSGRQVGHDGGCCRQLATQLESELVCGGSRFSIGEKRLLVYAQQCWTHGIPGGGGGDPRVVVNRNGGHLERRQQWQGLQITPTLNSKRNKLWLRFS